MLGSEDQRFYEAFSSAMRGTHSSVQENQQPTYPRYAASACRLRICFP
jgi:hypothetical protein